MKKLLISMAFGIASVMATQSMFDVMEKKEAERKAKSKKVIDLREKDDIITDEEVEEALCL
jgi:hypothetical protein